MKESINLELIEKALKASKTNLKIVKTIGFFTWRVKDGKTLLTRYDKLNTIESPHYVEQSRKDIFLINEPDENHEFYAIHACFVGTYRYKFNIVESGELAFLGQQLLTIR